MAQITQLQSTSTLGTDDQAILRQGTIDKRISLELAGTLSWAKRNGFTHVGSHIQGLSFTSTEDFSTFQGKVYFVKDEVSLPYTSTTTDPSVDTNMYNKDEEGLTRVISTGSDTSRYLADRFADQINIKDFGAVGDGITDDTDAIQAALYYASNGVPSKTDIIPLMTARTVFVPAGRYRITRQIHHPAWVKVLGESSTSLNSNGLANGQGTGSIIYADFTDTRQTAWLSSGYVRIVAAGLPAVGELVDVYKHNIDSGHYDSSKITRSYGSSISGVIFYTDKFVACAVGVGAASGAEADFAAYGFLTSYITNSSWGIKARVKGSSYHCGIMTWNSNGGIFEGYVNSQSSVSAPALDASSAPAGWYPANTLHNPAEIQYLTTGFYNVYANAVVLNNLITEGWGRARAFINVEGATDNSPYIEGIDEMGYHVVASRVTITSPQINSVPKGLVRASSAGNVTIENMKHNTKLDYGSQQTYGANARVVANYARQGNVAVNEVFSTAIDMYFGYEREVKIYVSIDGDDTLCGLNEDNAVRSFNIALDRAIYYDADIIYITDSETVLYGSTTKTIKKDLKVQAVTDGGSATINVEAGTDGYSNHLVLDNAKLTLVNITVNLNGTWSGSQSARGWIQPKDICSLVLDTSVINVADDPTKLTALQLRGNTSAILTVTGYTGSYNGSAWAFNEYENDSYGKVITAFTNFTTSATWPNTWTEL